MQEKPPIDAEAAEVATFVQYLYERSGLPSQRQFARKAEIEPTSLTDWMKGSNAPGGRNLLRMMRAAGVLDELIATGRLREAPAEAARPDEQPAQTAGPEELRAAVDRVLAATAAGFLQIGQRLDDLEQRLPPQAQEVERGEAHQ